MNSWNRIVALALFACLARDDDSTAAIVHADGRREQVEAPRQDSKGAWTVGIDGRRVAIVPGEIVVVVDEKGKETITIPPLADGAAAPESAPVLALLRDPKSEGWETAFEPLSRHPTRGLLDELVALTGDAQKEVRGRAIAALVRLRTRESVTEATKAVLAEKEPAVRRDAASALFAGQEIFRRSDAAKSVAAGLADKDGLVRVIFAQLSPPDCAAAIPVLKADGLKSSDHHVRESAALELGLRGDRAGESTLVDLLARSKMPGVDDPALMERLLCAEQIEVCAALGKIATVGARTALQKALSSPRLPVRSAAAAALGAMGVK